MGILIDAALVAFLFPLAFLLLGLRLARKISWPWWLVLQPFALLAVIGVSWIVTASVLPELIAQTSTTPGDWSAAYQAGEVAGRVAAETGRQAAIFVLIADAVFVAISILVRNPHQVSAP